MGEGGQIENWPNSQIAGSDHLSEPRPEGGKMLLKYQSERNQDFVIY